MIPLEREVPLPGTAERMDMSEHRQTASGSEGKDFAQRYDAMLATARQRGYRFEDPSSQALLATLAKVAPLHSPVLITGPTGTGKEILARLIHEHSGREGDFVPVNCAAVPDTLTAGQFFGHTRGSFTGAIDDRKGFFELASGGTLFLDEIGEQSPGQQALLLRVLDGHPYWPLGAKQQQMPNVRIVAATNRDLKALCHAGAFREDLYARLATIQIEVPPLADRPRDVAAVVEDEARKLGHVGDVFLSKITMAVSKLSALNGAWPLGMREVISFVLNAHLFGIEDTVQRKRSDWLSAPVLQDGWATKPPPGQRDREELTELIAALWQRVGVDSTKKCHHRALALANALLDQPIVTIEDVERSLEFGDPRTHKKYIHPLLDANLVVEASRNAGALEGLSVVWPPIEATLLQLRAGWWVPVQPHSIPMLESGAYLALNVRTRLHVHSTAVVVTHCIGGEVAYKQLGATEIHCAAEWNVSFLLDEHVGLEQILVFVTWPETRGVTVIDTPQESRSMPSPEALARERKKLMGGRMGWIREFLVHHIEPRMLLE